MKPAGQQPDGYGIESIQVLEGLEAVRRRPGMYIGSTDVRGLHHLAYEVVDNSVDEALAGYCDSVRIVLQPDNSVTVSDNGRGIPVDLHEKEQRPAAEVVLAYAGETVVGFALFFHNFSTFLGRPGLYLEDLFVMPDWRGRGIGRRLIVHLADIAIQRGCGRMEWAVLDWNESAIGFYQRIGARVMKEWQLCRLTGDSLARVAAGNS